MTAAERAQLMAVVNERAKQAKQKVRATASARVVELNSQLEADWTVQDFEVAQLVSQAQSLAKAANARIDDECTRLGILPELRPRMVAHFMGAYTTDKRRAQLRQLLKDENDAAVRAAELAIDEWRTNTREGLVRDGLGSAASLEFLDTLPAPADLLPQIDVKALTGRKGGGR